MSHDYTAEDGARIYLEKILAILDIEGKVVPEDLDETTVCYRIECKTDDARMLIGRNGQTLEALQFVVRQMCKGATSEQGPFVVDVLDYRARRRRNLEDSAKRGAVAVLNGDSERFALPPMSPYERRLVHQYLQEHFADLASESEGEGPDRHIVISYRGMPDGEKSDDEGEEEYYPEEEEKVEH
ncbi:MAG TPA: R3H domain-containing nucleic acid-binding protein [Planktothrix sp.]|jgi:spoIIIJ-associated protein